MNWYQADLLDHYQHPRNKGFLVAADIATGQHNPACGDSVALSIQLDPTHQQAIAIKFEGQGCVISLATASKLTELFTGKTLLYILDYRIEQISQLIGITLGPTRLKCALLPLEALQKGVRAYHARSSKTDCQTYSAAQ